MKIEYKFILATVGCIIFIWSPYNVSTPGFIVTDTVRGFETIFVTVWFPVLYWVLSRGS